MKQSTTRGFLKISVTDKFQTVEGFNKSLLHEYRIYTLLNWQTLNAKLLIMTLLRLNTAASSYRMSQIINQVKLIAK